MPQPRRARARYLASQQAANVALQQATNRARVTAPPAKGVQRAPNPAPGVGTPPGQPQASGGAEFTPDAEYLAAAAQRQFDRSEAIRALTSQSGTDKTDTAEAVRRLLSKAPDERRKITEGFNRSGLLYSGQLGKGLNTYEAGLTQQQNDINLDFDSRERARAAARNAIEQGMPLEEAAGLAESATRQIDRDTSAASANALVPTPVVPPPAAVVRKPNYAARARKVQNARRRPPTRRRA